MDFMTKILAEQRLEFEFLWMPEQNGSQALEPSLPGSFSRLLRAFFVSKLPQFP
jgi:hypothetical protein